MPVTVTEQLWQLWLVACGINIKNLGSLSVYEFAEFPGKKFDEDVVEAFRKKQD